jgi:hypothetical protein
MNASAAAPALAKTPRRTVAMRLADPAVMLAYVSLIFGLLLVFFPTSFPRIIIQNWQDASFMPAMILFTVSLNLGLYLRVTHQRSAKPGIIASACLGSVPVFILVGFNKFVLLTIAYTLSGHTPSVLAQVNEEILALTYFAIVAAIFFPFLLIRFAQQFLKRDRGTE